MMVIELFCMEEKEDGVVHEGISDAAAEELQQLFRGTRGTMTVEVSENGEKGTAKLSWIEDSDHDSPACFYTFERGTEHRSGGFCDKEWILHWFRRKILNMDEEEDREDREEVN